MAQDVIVFEAKFRNIETDKELSYYISASGSNAWETALEIAEQHESQNDSLLLIELKYLGLMLPME